MRELPTFPVTQAVLQGYSRAHLFNSLPTMLHAPGGVYRKDTDPLVTHNLNKEDSGPLLSPGVQAGLDEDHSIIHPVENHVHSDTLLSSTEQLTTPEQQNPLLSNKVPWGLIRDNATVCLQVPLHLSPVTD